MEACRRRPGQETRKDAPVCHWPPTCAMVSLATPCDLTLKSQGQLSLAAYPWVGTGRCRPLAPTSSMTKPPVSSPGLDSLPPLSLSVGCGPRRSVHAQSSGEGSLRPQRCGPLGRRALRSWSSAAPRVALDFGGGQGCPSRRQLCLPGHPQGTAGIKPRRRDCGSLLTAAQLRPQ